MERSSGSDVLRELLGADDEHVLGDAAADEGVGLGDAVGVAGAGGADVVGGGGVRADAVGEQRRHRGRDGDVADRRDEHGADLVGVDARLLDRLERGRLGEVDGVDALARALAGDDAGALANPLVARVDRADDVVVRAR